MKLLNKDTWKHKPYTVFVTSYTGLHYFNKWSQTVVRNNDNLQLVIVDTGNQAIANSITDIPIFQLQNVGCAGCWNMCALLGFNYYNLDKIIIGQDDAMFDEQMINLIWDQSNDDMLIGAYDRGFTYSLFGLTKKFWTDVGVFDENFVYATYEDNDYIHRIRLLNKQWKSLNFSADLNSNITSKYLSDDIRSVNRAYMIEKWGHFEGVYEHPFNNPDLLPNECVIHKNLTDVYGDVSTFPSITEFETLMSDIYVT